MSLLFGRIIIEYDKSVFLSSSVSLFPPPEKKSGERGLNSMKPTTTGAIAGLSSRCFI